MKTMDDLWQEEREHLHDRLHDRERAIRKFDAEYGDYPSVGIDFSKGMQKIVTPCCKNEAWFTEPMLHKCSFCRRYYYVVDTD